MSELTYITNNTGIDIFYSYENSENCLEEGQVIKTEVGTSHFFIQIRESLLHKEIYGLEWFSLAGHHIIDATGLKREDDQNYLVEWILSLTHNRNEA